MPMKCREAALTSWKNSLGRLRGADEEVKPVQFLPDFQRDLVAHHAGVFARLADGLHEGVGVFVLKHEEFGDRLRGGPGMQLEERFLVAGGLHDGQPVFRQLFFIQMAHVQQQLQVDIHDPGDVFRPFNMTGHPVERTGNAA
jgi:hypothetical protein